MIAADVTFGRYFLLVKSKQNTKKSTKTILFFPVTVPIRQRLVLFLDFQTF